MPILEGFRLRNYRCFGEDSCKIDLTKDFVALVGVNNSGKSSALRALYELRPLFDLLANSDVSGGVITQGLQGHLGFSTNVPTGERIQRVGRNDWPAIDLFFSSTNEEVDPSEAIGQLTIQLVNPNNAQLELHVGTPAEPIGTITRVNQGNGARNRAVLVLTTSGGIVRHADWDVIRDEIRLLANTLYVGPYRNAVNSGSADYYDIRIGQGFITSFNDFKNGTDPQARESITRLSGELAAIFGFNHLEINPSNDLTQLNLVVDDRSFRASELGAGINQFVIVAANVMVRRPSLLLIDEPELNLHASLQLKFLQLLAKYTDRGVLFATHSMGLARSGAGRTIVCERDGSGTSRLSPYHGTEELSTLLGELGYDGYNDVAYRAVLLVEGVNEVRAMLELLSKYDVRNQVVVVPLGGDDLANGKRQVELAEIRRLSDKMFAIVDSERIEEGGEPEARRLDFAKSCEKQGIRCLLTERRSFENYLDFEAARDVMPSLPNLQVRPIGPFERPAEAGFRWKKERNWRVVERMSREAFETTDLGKFVAQVAQSALSS